MLNLSFNFGVDVVHRNIRLFERRVNCLLGPLTVVMSKERYQK
jgi:hypothetical protein